MVSLVAQPATPVAIFLCCQALKLVSSCRTCCQASSRRASSVGCPSSEDDSLNSLEGMSSLGLDWCRFRRADWTFSWSDSTSVFSCTAKTWLTLERVFRIGEWPGPSLPSEPAWPSLKTSASSSRTSAYSSSRGPSSSTWEGWDSLQDSRLSLVVQDGVEPDRQLRCEVIPWAQLRD